MDLPLLNVLNGQKPREIAAHILQQRTGLHNDFVENVLEKVLAQSQLSPPDRGLCQELVYGVVRWQAALDALIARKTDGRPQPPQLQNLLRLGLYQIFWLDRIPDHAAVHDSVELAKHGGFGRQAGFVNAILRGYLRDSDATRQLLAALKEEQPPLGYSHPEWLVARWQKRWGADKAARLMEWNNTPPKSFARLNTLKLPDRKLENGGPVLLQWRAENVEYDFVRRDWFEENLVFLLKTHPPFPTLPSLQHGLFYIQDPSTLLAIRELDPRPGENVLDLCAAPGGKTTYIAQLMDDRGMLMAYDSAPERLRLVEENCARLGVTCVKTIGNRESPADTQPAPLSLLPSHFHKILVDAPCSNTGVMRRRVDLRWRIRPEEIERLQAEQLELMRRAAPLLRVGGTLVYSTCSLEPEENQTVVERFLGENPGFRLERERELLPFVDETDGAFVAKLVRAQ